MHFHELYSEISLWIGLLLGFSLVLLVLIASYSARGAVKKKGEEEDGHGSAPVPLILKVLYIVFVLWATGYTLWVILSGKVI